MSGWEAFGIGLLGAFFIYAVRFRTERLRHVLAYPRENWRMILFDLGIFLVLGGLVVVFLINPATPKEAFLGGATWEGFITNLHSYKAKEGDS